jgi:hypothetical protein
MKKILSIIASGCLFATFAHGTVINLSGTISVNDTLRAADCYRLQGCVVVPNGVSLYIEPGTQIRGTSGSNLIVERGGKIYAMGTINSPVIFTSNQPDTLRGPGDWGGISIFGYAENNVVNGGGGTYTITKCTNHLAGGSNDGDNSGILRYVRIEFAGEPIVGHTETNALNLACVGNLTEITNVQISASAHSSFRIIGGDFDTKYLISYNARQADFDIEYGCRAKMQFITGIRKDGNANIGAPFFSNGVTIRNNSTNLNNVPLTNPLISNLTILGPYTCDNGPLSGNFRNGIVFENNGAGHIVNSAIAGYPDNGLLINDVASVANTASNLLNFSSNTILSAAGGNEYNAGASWSTGCGGLTYGMVGWITNNPSAPSCKEQGNDFSLSTFGYDQTTCGDFCADAPDWAYSSNELEGTLFAPPFDDPFFTEVDYKGAFQEDDWTILWSEFCPTGADYCSLAELRQSGEKVNILSFIPNPTRGSVVATFNWSNGGLVTLEVMDRVSGQSLHKVNQIITAPGEQRIAFSADQLKEGVYLVRIGSNGKYIYGQLVVE